MPGDPQDVKATPVNSTTIKVNWKPPNANERNGVIRGYHIHVQEMKEEVSHQISCGVTSSRVIGDYRERSC